MDHVDVNGLQIAFLQAGSGPPLVLLHGGVGQSREWRRQLDGLSDEFTVIAWDAPGCGQSSDPPESFRLPDFADTLAGFVRALGFEKPHVGGLSFGGGLALELYRRHPEIPRSLVLAGAYAGWAGSLPADEVRVRLDTALRHAEMRPEEIVQEWLPGLFTEEAPQAVIDELTEIILEARAVGLRVAARSFAEADLRDVLPKIDVPTLLLYGDLDVRSPLHVAEALHGQIPDSKLVIMPGVGHMSSMEASELFNTEVRRFLKEVA